MLDQNKKFENIDALNEFILRKEEGHILIEYRNMSDYPGMVLGLGIIFNIKQSKYELDLEWVCFGLDLYGENLLENYLYKFNSLIALLDYLESKYSITVKDIPMSFKIDQELFPNPIKDIDQEPLYKTTWQKFQEDFGQGIFLDGALQLVYSSNPASLD